MKNIAVVAGGYSSEREVSLKSARSIIDWLDRELYTPYLVVVDAKEWYVQREAARYPIDKNDFSCILPSGVKVKFDYAFITIHGTPGEDGLFQGYLDLLAIPYNTGGVLTEALTANKYFCNRYLSTLDGVHVAQSLRLAHYGAEDLERAKLMGFPLFVKPNTGGSSFATTKVHRAEDLSEALELALKEAPEAMVEQFIEGTEVTVGCYSDAGGVLGRLAVTEVVTKNEFFDYDAKYNGAVEEITPARISPELTERLFQLSEKIYRYIAARGIIRIDYIIDSKGEIWLLEVNTTPGMTATSFIPQQVAYCGKSMSEFLTSVIKGTSR